MIEENVDFLEEYKHLDNLLKDSLQTSEGVSEYIRIMESERLDYKNKDFYQKIKHLRWIRNQLAHNPETMRQDMCDQDDIDDIKSIYNSIMKMEDPKSLQHKKEKHINQQKNKIEVNETNHTWLFIGLLIVLIIIVIYSIF